MSHSHRHLCVVPTSEPSTPAAGRGSLSQRRIEAFPPRDHTIGPAANRTGAQRANHRLRRHTTGQPPCQLINKHHPMNGSGCHWAAGHNTQRRRGVFIKQIRRIQARLTFCRGGIVAFLLGVLCEKWRDWIALAALATG